MGVGRAPATTTSRIRGWLRVGIVRLRLSGMGRVEAHGDGTEDARSLYFSLDLRRLF